MSLMRQSCENLGNKSRMRRRRVNFEHQTNSREEVPHLLVVNIHLIQLREYTINRFDIKEILDMTYDPIDHYVRSILQISISGLPALLARQNLCLEIA